MMFAEVQLAERFTFDSADGKQPFDRMNGGGKMSEPSYDELKAKLAELEKQVSGKRAGNLAFRVSEKGAVSVYGMGRFPVTLYYEQWNKLLDRADDLRAFLDENKSKLKLKE
jgi:hypothetical protein